MVYKFLILSDEDELFLREIAIDADSTFLDFHDAIIDACDYDAHQMASFFICNEEWEKEQEITLVEMDTSSEYDSLTMGETVLSDYVIEEGQRLLYIFDYMMDRAFFIRLEGITTGKNLDKPACLKAEGNAPEQISMDDDSLNNITKSVDLDADFYGDEDFELDELDEEGFSDMDFSEEME